MKLNTKDFVSQLEKAVAGLNFISEDDSELKVIAPIQSDGGGELSIEKLLTATGFLTTIEVEDFLESFEKTFLEKKHREKAESLIALLQADFTDVQIYRISSLVDDFGEVYEHNAFSFITAKKGDYIGIAPKIDAETHDRRSEIIPFEKYQTTDENLLDATAKIEAMLKDAKWSIVEYIAEDTKKEFVLSVAPTKELLFKTLMSELNFVKICKYEGFGDSVYDPENVTETVDEIGHVKRESPKKTEAEQLFAENLSDTKEYVIGAVAAFQVCDLGRTEDGDYTGVSASVTWT